MIRPNPKLSQHKNTKIDRKHQSWQQHSRTFLSCALVRTGSHICVGHGIKETMCRITQKNYLLLKFVFGNFLQIVIYLSQSFQIIWCSRETTQCFSSYRCFKEQLFYLFYSLIVLKLVIIASSCSFVHIKPSPRQR